MICEFLQNALNSEFKAGALFFIYKDSATASLLGSLIKLLHYFSI